MLPYLKLFRTYNIILAICSVLIANHLINGDNIIFLIYAVMAVTLSMLFGNMLNDLLDVKIDKISHPNRPLVLNNIAIDRVKKLLLCVGCIIIILSIFLADMARFYLLVIILPLLISYNYYFKTIPIIGNLIVSFLLASVFIFTEILFYQQVSILIIPSLLVFSFSFLREMLKDIHDYDGDKEYNMKTLPIILGISRSIQYFKFLTILFCIFLLLPYFLNYYSINYLIAVIILIEIPLIILLSLLLRNPNKLMLKKATAFMKIINILGLLVILIANN